ncbi:hypothetical protein EV363DRAFT_720558 [Boletus edulis]|nr:hypothetical protein EV363DRAFT_720558 [Boletus edulis]
MKRQRWEGRLTPMLNCFIEDVYQKRWYRIWAVATATCFLGRAARYVWSKDVLGPDTHCLRRTPAWCMSLQPNALRSSSSSGGMSSSQDGVRSVWASVASGTRPGATIASGGGRFWRGACKAGQTRKVTFRCTHTLQSPVYTCPISPPNPSFRGQQTHGPSQATSGVRVGAHHQTGTRINATTGTGTGTEMDRDRDRDRGYYRRDTWTSRNDYSPNRPSPSRRGYGPRDSEWRGRDDYRRERNRERGRSRDHDEPRPRDREHDRRPPSPVYRPAPPSPRRGESTVAHVGTCAQEC